MVRKITPTAGGWGKRSAASDPQRAFEYTASRAIAAAPWATDAWRTDLSRRLTDQLLAGRALHPSIAAAMRTAIAQIIDLETSVLETPETAPADIIAAVHRRMWLRGLLAFTTHGETRLQQWIDGLGQILRRIADAIPPIVDTTGTPSLLAVPLIDRIPEPVALVTYLATTLLRFSNDDPNMVVPGAVLAARVQELMLDVSKISDEAARKNPHRLMSPKLSGLTGEALIRAYLPEPFTTLLSTSVPFTIPRKKWASHGLAAGPPNAGKTQSLQALTYELLQEPNPPGLVILDPHGDFFYKVLALDLWHPTRGRLQHRLQVFDPTDPTRVPAFNFLDLADTTTVGAEQTFAFLLSTLAAEWTRTQATAATYLLKLLRRIPNASLDTLRLILDDRAKSAATSIVADTIHALPSTDRDYFINIFYDGRMQVTKHAMASKIYQLQGNDTWRAMFSGAHNSLDAYRAMNESKIVLVNGGEATLGREGMAVFLQFIVGQFYAAAFRRAVIPERDRHLCLLIVDEASHVIVNPMIKSFLTETRKFAVGACFATQVLEGIPVEVKAALYGATAIRFASSVSSADATILAREMYTTPEFLRSMGSVEGSHAEWAVQVEGLTNKQALRLRLPFGVLERAPRMTPAEIEQVRTISHARLAAAAPTSPLPSPSSPAPTVVAPIAPGDTQLAPLRPHVTPTRTQ